MPQMTYMENRALEIFCNLVDGLNAIQHSADKLLTEEGGDEDVVVVVKIVNKMLVKLRAGETQASLNKLVNQLEALELFRTADTNTRQADG